MYLAKVTGVLVPAIKHASLNGSKLLIAARPDENYRPTVHAWVAVDTVGAGNGEIVIITVGSSVRMSNNENHSMIDAAVVDTIDSPELNG